MPEHADQPDDFATRRVAQASEGAALALDHGHVMAWEQSGSLSGLPVVVLHGGPGSGSNPRHREFFDAAKYRIVQFDQRGCGRSTPLGETMHNHTGALVDDIERLREHLGIERWLVFGGSWGAALALAYAAKYPQHTSGLVLRGIYLTGNADNDWFFHGASAFAPEAHARFMQLVPRRWQRSLLTWLERTFRDGEEERKAAVAAAWQRYETALVDPSRFGATDSAPLSPASAATWKKYTVQAHYLARRCFLGESAVMRCASGLRSVPTALVHGTLDFVCRPVNSLRVQHAIAGSRLAWAQGAGHDPLHPESKRLLCAATDRFHADGDFSRWPAEVDA